MAPLASRKEGEGGRSAWIDRLKISLISTAGYWAIRILGCTLRWEVEGWENFHAIEAAGRRRIFTFWHGRILPAAYFFRGRGIVVMTSRNTDGEYIARVIRRLGYGTARGSSSRGAGRALVEMIRELRNNRDVGFTIDGPRGPRYVAKPGAVWIASKTGDGIFPFHASPEKSWILNSWDRFHVPKPFTRVLILMGPPIFVDRDASDELLAAFQQKLQYTLENLLERGDSYWKARAGR
jgi:lysophospholipid acyltransferase (LPLAT)-like uncharacterized protein